MLYKILKSEGSDFETVCDNIEQKVEDAGYKGYYPVGGPSVTVIEDRAGTVRTGYEIRRFYLVQLVGYREHSV